MADQDTREELNRLYWESEDSVGDIADRLDISRRALYDMIDPLPADAPCPECGATLGFRNRTNAENRDAECQECGREVRLDGELGDPEPELEQESRASSLSPTRRIPAEGSGPMLGAMLVAGMGIGATVASLLRRQG